MSNGELSERIREAVELTRSMKAAPGDQSLFAARSACIQSICMFPANLLAAHAEQLRHLYELGEELAAIVQAERERLRAEYFQSSPQNAFLKAYAPAWIAPATPRKQLTTC